MPGSVFIDGLGSTEMGHSAFHITHRADTDRYGRCIGSPHAFADVAVLDPDGEQVPAGVVGHLGIEVSDAGAGLLERLGHHVPHPPRGYYLTGDLVYRDEDGYYYHLDRAVDSVDLGDGACSTRRCRRSGSWPPARTSPTAPWSRRRRRHGRHRRAAGAAAGADEPTTAPSGSAPRWARTSPPTLRRVVVVRDADIPVTVTGKVRKLVLRERYLTEAARAGAAA